MNLDKLFKTQKKLDDRIVAEKGLEGVNLLDKKTLALQVELGELANEWRGFKFWSENQRPRTEHICKLCEGGREISAITDGGSTGETYEVDVYDVDIQCPLCEGYDNVENPLLEEYVDSLHFLLSIGNDGVISRQGMSLLDESVINHNIDTMLQSTILKQFYATYTSIAIYSLNKTQDSYETRNDYERVFLLLLGLGQLLGFSWDQVERAYYDKNKINHTRQDEGY